MITNKEIKFIKSLQQKKYRTEHQCLVVEGVKMVDEMLQSDYQIRSVYALKEWIDKNQDLPIKPIKISSKELDKISAMQTPNQVVAVAYQKKTSKEDRTDNQNLTLVLDRIQDPGNLGNIIRIADWFGISTIVCSNDTVEQYNPKVIQSTMGALFRVNLIYTDLIAWINKIKKNSELFIYGTCLSGESIFQTSLKKNGVVIMGNESDGISEAIIQQIDIKLRIPDFSNNIQKTESLNVAAATAIICAEFRRQAKFA